MLPEQRQNRDPDARDQDSTIGIPAEDLASTLLQAVQNSSDLIGVGDLAGKFTFVNDAFLKMTGRKPEEVIGNHFATILSANNPATLAEAIGRGALGSGWNGDCILRRRDGTDFPVFLNVGPIRDKEGRITGMFGIARDITERKEKEEALREAHGQLNRALKELKKQAEDAARLSELVDILQSCQNAEEAFEIIGNVLQGILQATVGSLYLNNALREALVGL